VRAFIDITRSPGWRRRAGARALSWYHRRRKPHRLEPAREAERYGL